MDTISDLFQIQVDFTMVLKSFWLVLFLLSPYASSSSSIPHIVTKGTYYEVGKDVGSTFKPKIQEYYKLHPMMRSTFIPWSHTSTGKSILNEYYSIIEHEFPQYLHELYGIADGAEIPFIQVLMMNLQMEISVIIRNTSTEPSECSDVYNNLPSHHSISIAHNEDTLPLVKNLSYFVTAHIVDTKNFPTSRIQVKEEEFMAYCYPGVLPGSTFGFNKYGLIQTGNALYPTLIGRNKTGRYILARAALTAQNVDQVVSILQNQGTGVATGFSLNIGVLPNTTSSSSPEIWNIELAPTNTPVSKVDVYQLKPDVDGGNYFHVNKYRRILVPEIQEKIKSSIERSARIKQLLPTNTNTDLLDILGDTTNQNYPIYRTPRPTDDGCTVATGLFDLIQRRLNVYTDNPKGSEPVVTFPLDWSK